MFELDPTPQSPMKVWSQGIRLGWAGFPKLIALTTVLAFISLLPTIYMADKLGNTEVTPDVMQEFFRQGHFIRDLLLLELLMLVLSSFVNALIIRRLDHTVHGTQPAHEFGFASSKLLSLMLAGILVVVTLIIGLIIAVIIGGVLGAVLGTMLGHDTAIVVSLTCFLIATIFISVNLVFFQFAIVLDSKGPVSSLNHSCALVFRNWWRTFLVLLITLIVIMFIAVLVTLVMLSAVHGHLLQDAMDNGRAMLVKGILNLVGAALLAPFVMGILYALYHDLGMRYTQRSTHTGVVQA
ncbi:MAG: hypothetical protein WBR15_00500 [Gammaproteobacteria bacterium]